MTPILLAGTALLALLVLLIRHTLRMQLDLAAYWRLHEHLTQGVLQLDAKGYIEQHNQSAARLLGKPSEDLNGISLSSCLPQFSWPVQQTEPRPGMFINTEGLHLEVEITPRTRASGRGALVLIQPITEPIRSQEDVERFKHSQYFARIGTWDWAIDTNRLYWSEAIYALFGYPPGAVTPSYELFCASVHPDDRSKVRAGELRCIETGENHDEEYRVVWPDGSVHWLRETGNVIKDAMGKPIKMMGVVRDITEEKAWTSELHQLAHHDPLTGLPNRLLFEDRLRSALDRAQRNKTRVALVFIDLNAFKAVNDRLGHRAGDQLLVCTAKRLQSLLRASDSVVRLGGDEFVLILEGLAPSRSLPDEASHVGDKIFAALAAPVELDGMHQHINASLGIAFYPDHATSMDRLILMADLAMYEAKRSGDNQYRLGQANPQHQKTE